jgi:hypothetical protein
MSHVDTRSTFVNVYGLYLSSLGLGPTLDIVQRVVNIRAILTGMELPEQMYDCKLTNQCNRYNNKNNNNVPVITLSYYQRIGARGGALD